MVLFFLLNLNKSVGFVKLKGDSVNRKNRGRGIKMEKGVSKGLMIMVGIVIFGILVVVTTNAFMSANNSADGFQQGLCLNTPGLTAEDCE